MSTPRKLSPVEVFELIQELLKECSEKLGLDEHARERMAVRNVNVQDILHVLRNGTVSPAVWNDKYQNWRYPVSGHDLDGAHLRIIVVPEARFCRITIVTVMDT